MQRIRELIHEIHRRSLWQVLGIYLVSSWAVLQVADTLGGALNLPGWFPSVAFALLIVGLPIVLATAFVQEGIGPGRSESRQAHAPVRNSSSRSLLTWRNALAGGVLAFASWGVLAAGWLLFTTTVSPQAASGERSVAVMPCDDLTPARDQAPLAQGIAEGVIHALAKIPDLKVSGPTSVVALRARGADALTVARTLDVSTVLECGLQRADDVVRVRPRLVEAATGTVLWSTEIDAAAGDIFAIQDTVARAVTERLQVAYTGTDGGVLVTERTTSRTAHASYLRGRHLLYQRTAESLRHAIQAFEEAIRADPGYAEPHAGITQASLLLIGYSLDLEPEEVRSIVDRAPEAARTSVALDPDLGLGHVALGMSAVFEGRYREARGEASRAVELGPSSADALGSAATIFLITGSPDEALAYAERATILDPINPQFMLAHVSVLRALGRADDALARSAELVTLAPTFANGWFQRLQLLVERGADDEARAAWLRLGGVWPVPRETSWEAAFDGIIRYRESGVPTPLPDLDRVPVQSRPALSVLFGRHDQAIATLGRLLDLGAYVYVPLFDAAHGSPLRGDPAYDELLRRAGVTW